MSVAPETAAIDESSGLGTVRVVGTGLLGSSIGLGLRSAGVRVLLADRSAASLALAHEVGAGEPDDGTTACSLIVVATPPDVTAAAVAVELAAHPDATVTDVASVKSGLGAAIRVLGGDVQRYVGGHPMAGRERSGPVAAQADLFLGRPWVICPDAGGDPGRVAVIRRLAQVLGATPLTMPADEHDRAVALVSHVPQIAASLVAARLCAAPDPAVSLAGQGLRDVTRIAAGDPGLWAQILAANAGPVAEVLSAVRSDLDVVLEALCALAPGSASTENGAARLALARLMANGNSGVHRIPGKHGSAPMRYAVVTTLVPDSPGQLARLFTDIGDAGVNVEEFSLEHSPGQQVGLASVSVLPASRDPLEQALAARGWHVVA